MCMEGDGIFSFFFLLLGEVGRGGGGIKGKGMLHALAGYPLTLQRRLAALSESDVEQLDLCVPVLGCGRQICVRHCYRFLRSFTSIPPAKGGGGGGGGEGGEGGGWRNAEIKAAYLLI